MEAIAKVDRTTGLGGTDIAAVVGVHPTKTRFSVYAEKLGLVAPEPQTERMKMGLMLQPIVVELYEEATKRRVEWFDQTIRHPAEPMIVGTPDGFLAADTPDLYSAKTEEGTTTFATPGFEAKTAGLDQAWRWGLEGDQIPEEYLLQCQWYMALTGRALWVVAALLGGSMFRHFTLAEDEELQAMLFDEGKKFWHDHIVKQVPPEIDASRAATEYLRRRYPAPVLEVRDADDRELELMANIVRLRQEEKYLHTQREVAQNALRLRIGEAKGVVGGDYRALWSMVKGGHVEYERKPARKLDVRSKRKGGEIGDSSDDE